MKLRVNDGARTRDLLDHNQALCQLSYTHHAAHTAAFVRWRLEPDTGNDPVTSSLPRTRSATELVGRVLLSAPGGIQTRDNRIRRPLLYSLSYGGVTAHRAPSSGRRDSNPRHLGWKPSALAI
jgi:hypothetical protein